ncbi:hypothetical protein B0O99DRAFT_389738 [Bisporella sp. PMI_857]|nr:hypothetical protein B0O99DRAFT_389738 [Bisporella sp. PMI_857]
MIANMAPRRRPKIDNDVIKTEKDYQRATGREDENNFEIEEEKVNLDAKLTFQEWIYQDYTNKTASHYKRARLRQGLGITGTDIDEAFPFLRFPPEIRNMIYRYMVISRAETRIHLDTGVIGKFYKPGGIETAILSTCKQIHNEASKIMYDENKCIAFYSVSNAGVAFRIDEQKTKSATSRTLRSGRAVGMMKYKGLIYPHIFGKLRQVEFHVDIPSRVGYCDHMVIYMAKSLRSNLESLEDICRDMHKNTYDVRDHYKKWKIVVHSDGGSHGTHILGSMLEAIRCAPIPFLVKCEKITLTLDGKFPKNWQKLFYKFKGFTGFVTKDVEEIEGSRQISRSFIAQFLYSSD